MTVLTIEQAVSWGIGALADSSPSAKVDSQLLLCFVLDKNTTYLFTWPEKALDTKQLSTFEALVARRKQGEPVAYLTGERGFWTLNLKTNNSTLIPRADTECLVECALQTITDNDAKVLDLGTGTGAIALALAYEKQAWYIHACDLNQAAVSLALHNAQQLSREDNDGNITIVQSNWFEAYEEHHKASFDLIISNPPYIDQQDVHLGQGDLRFEPTSALVAQDNGFADIFKIIGEAPKFLKPKGWLMIEHGFEQGESVRRCFDENGFSQVDTCKDLSKNERFTIGCLYVGHM